MAVQLTAIAIFVAVFVIGILRKIHLGPIMLATATGVGMWLGSMTLDDVLDEFPVSIMILLAGVTYFFAIAQENGTVDRIINRVIGIVGDRAVLLPFAMFGITTGIAAMGAPLAGLVMVPIAMPLGKKYNIDSVLMGIFVGSGILAGGFAPTSLFGIVSYGTAHAAGIPLSPILLFLIALMANVILILIAFFMFGGLQLLQHKSRFSKKSAPRPSLESEERLPQHPFEREGYKQRSVAVAERVKTEKFVAKVPEPMTATQRITILCMGVLIVAVIAISSLGGDPDIGILCFALATVMALVDPNTGRAAIVKTEWSTILMVGGIITYVGVLQQMGAVDLLAEGASEVGSPWLAAFVICLIGSLVAAFASTTGMIAALMPLAIPLVTLGDLAGWAVIASLGICASVVDLSPFSTVGATVVATVDEEERPRVQSRLMRWGMSLVVIAPVVCVSILVFPTSL
ncbi:MAG TPA: C4-dicarboxylate ABC transporter [Candidatus Yaniella excrementigallinarum]|nr:C4-dicarboxylate ABC transporter [Candidatus Yaniella excrementigallinarum]